ncbi:MAG TPA: phosphoribosylaminoimidazolesuccinocarboxamide synthase [Pseudobdellovibrionaceae bacterium]|nr:phosphoribosylaminoimidazolesuccinocarboxamide synthase [Pseudobdellovibrionaceae bacterium]
MTTQTMNFQRGELFYEGKAKRLYKVVGREDLIWQEFKDSLTAFNAQKKGSFEDKGAINREICGILYSALEAAGVPTHRVQLQSNTAEVTKKLKMVKLELVVRNVLAGSTAKKFGLEEGSPLAQPLVEFYYKDDALADPFVSDDQALMIGAAGSQSELEELKRFALRVNEVLRGLMGKVGLRLVDFKIEVGRDAEGRLVLGDEISPDTCRLWDEVSGEKLDKDRFRRDLGGVREAYVDVLQRLKQTRVG